MQSSSLFPLMLLVLGTLAPWTVEGVGNGKLKPLWHNLGYRAEVMGAPGGVGMSPSRGSNLSV